MSDDSAKIIFPCDYPIKVMGRAADDFTVFVLDVMQRHAETVLHEQVQVKQSRNGKFVSVTVTITATGEPQLRAIHQELMASGRVQMVL